MKQKLVVMLQLQDKMNQKVHPEWKAQSFEWYRAIWIECAELMDHYGWKWWKKQDPDREQVILELIDIWHFGLGLMLEQGEESDALAVRIAEQMDLKQNSGDFLQSVERFAASVLTNKSFDIKGFSAMMVNIGLSFDQLYQSYVGKNVLNFFRQDHGYKDGSYQKMWHEKEDNEHLVEIVSSLDVDSPSFQEDVYAGLEERYPA